MDNSNLDVSPVAKFTAESGYVFDVARLTLYGQQEYKAQANEAYPMPDAALYEVEIEDPLTPGGKYDATDNPEYVQKVLEVAIRRNFYYQMLLIEHCITSPLRDDLIAQYADLLKRQSPVRVATGKGSPPLLMELPTPWTKVLYYFLAEPDEINRMAELIQGKLPLSEGEVLNGFRYFRRLELQRLDSAGSATGKTPRRITGGRKSTKTKPA